MPHFPRRKKRHSEIEPDEILIDASNKSFDTDRFEGRLERPLSTLTLWGVGVFLVLALVLLAARAADLQIIQGTAFAQQAQNNQLEDRVLFADRGVLYDRNGTPLAYNSRTNVTDDFAQRVYANFRGLAHAVGYVEPPAKDSSGVYYRTDFTGLDGAEKAFDAELKGQNGMQLTETNAFGKIVSQSTTQPPTEGQSITLSIDAPLTQELYDAIGNLVHVSNFQAGSGVIIDVKTGEILAMTSYPEYPQNALEAGDPAAVAALQSDPRQPFLDRATDGLYAPGSIVKPIVATAALTEGVIDENKQILSTGSISVPNPYDPAHPSVFLDWRPNGLVDVRQALAVSSDVYFYEVGGGYQDQPGLGITKLDEYFKLFGFGTAPDLPGFSPAAGNVPTPAWKAATFPNDPTWRLGDTYHTAIGQYGMQITPLQVALEAAAIANGGTLLTPTFIASSTPQGVALQVSAHALEVVREGMRLGVTSGIAQTLNFPFVEVAAKTGTAQVGAKNQYENSSVIGFFPYDNPRYAFAIMLERAPVGIQHTAVGAIAQVFQWLEANEPQYLQ